MTFLLHNIGAKVNENYNTIEEILATSLNETLTFDGVYRNVFENRHLLKGRNIILFVTGAYVGKDNSFDAPMPLEQFCTWDEIMQIATETGASIGWHTWTHRDLTTLSEEEIRKELTPPFPMDFVAYPYGKFDDRVLRIAQEFGYTFGYSVHQGDDSQFQKKRSYL